MKKYRFALLLLAILLLAAPLAWGCSGAQACDERDPNEKQMQLIPGDTAPQQSQGKFRTRGLALGKETGIQAQEEAQQAGVVPVPERDDKSIPLQEK